MTTISKNLQFYEQKVERRLDLRRDWTRAIER